MASCRIWLRRARTISAYEWLSAPSEEVFSSWSCVRAWGLTAAGIALGLLGGAAFTRVMAGLLFGVSTMDAMTFASVPLALIATAMLAIYIPARRATRVDPVVALRDE
jgi:hypothetical protein